MSLELHPDKNHSPSFGRVFWPGTKTTRREEKRRARAIGGAIRRRRRLSCVSRIATRPREVACFLVRAFGKKKDLWFFDARASARRENPVARKKGAFCVLGGSPQDGPFMHGHAIRVSLELGFVSSRRFGYDRELKTYSRRPRASDREDTRHRTLSRAQTPVSTRLSTPTNGHLPQSYTSPGRPWTTSRT